MYYIFFKKGSKCKLYSVARITAVIVSNMSITISSVIELVSMVMRF